MSAATTDRPRNARLSRANAIPLTAGSSAAIGAVVTLVLFALSTEDGPVLCPFRRCTGGYCPGCGLTRSGGRLLRGDLAGSWQQHPYLIFGAAQLALVGTIWAAGSNRHRELLRSKTMALLIVNSVAITALWVVRLFNGSIPVPFS